MGEAAGQRGTMFFAVALVVAGAMTSAAALAADAKLQVALLTSAALFAFFAGGFLLGARSGARLYVAIRSHLSGARAVQARLLDERLAQKRERAGLIAELADAQAAVKELAERNSALVTQLAQRRSPVLGRQRALRAPSHS
jgi:hypothetical protein